MVLFLHSVRQSDLGSLSRHHPTWRFNNSCFIPRITAESPGSIRHLVIGSIIQPLELSPHVPHNLRQLLKVYVFLCAQQISPDGGRKHSVALHQPLVVRQKHRPPLGEHVLEVLLAQRVGVELVPYDQTVLGSVKGLVGKVLDPYWGMRLGEHAEADLQHVHVEEGDLGPIRKGWLESEGCAKG
jgi:hypothetical protein